MPQGLPLIVPPAYATISLEGHVASLMLSRRILALSLLSEAGSDVRLLELRSRLLSPVRSPIEAGSDVRPQCSSQMFATRPPLQRICCV